MEKYSKALSESKNKTRRFFQQQLKCCDEKMCVSFRTEIQHGIIRSCDVLFHIPSRSSNL